MRLLKLLTYALLGYVLYELLLGMTEPRVTRASRAALRHERAGSRDLHRALNEDRGRMNLTGPGRGRIVATEDSDGGTARHMVGRGVVY